MKGFKKVGIILACMSMFAGVLAACSGNGNEKPAASQKPAATNAETAGEDNPYKDPMEISVAFWDVEAEMAKVKNDPIVQEILAKFNITIKPVNTTWDDYGQKIQMWAASGQLPDVFAIDAIGTQYQRKWVDQGVVSPLPDLAKFPNLEAYFQTSDIAGLAVDGEHYTIPRRMFPSVDWSALDRVVYYRWDLAQAAGITKEPETWDEFQAMLDAIVKADPEGEKTTGLTAAQVKMLGGFFWLYGNPVATSDGSGADFKWIKEDGKFIPAVFSKNALPALQNMKDMYDNNLIDPDIALTSPDIAYDKFASGKAAAMLSGGGFINLDLNINTKRWAASYPDKDISEVVKVLKPLEGPDGERHHAIFKTYWSESYFSGKIAPKKLDRILALYDYVLSPEGKALITYGKEGVDYKVEGDQKVMLTDIPHVEKYPATGFLRDLVAYETSDRYDISHPAIADEGLRQDAVDYIDWILANTKVPDYDIRLTYMSTPTKDSFTVFDHDDLLNVMLAKEPVEQAWQKIVDGYKSKGLDKMIEEVNAKAKEEGIE
ncbi:extracellular solute-binding protein [Paenibacillus sp. PAMC21692]|uniref:extracellular solute-binding protein n=1 Tax=Paenibacillus sp. PAMC21692 TaxID=2762320 RepID=UPI00164D1B77|nr:extracellular solute-binding protein [Paenibacillus sp. PAMC21692]QNK60283.1 extracellular solute-binding protein [Paenibacillus sp. PAMC21692]